MSMFCKDLVVIGRDADVANRVDNEKGRGSMCQEWVFLKQGPLFRIALKDTPHVHLKVTISTFFFQASSCY